MSMVTFVIPAFNSGETIRATIESVLAQSDCDAEVIVVDDGSTDDTQQIASAGAVRVLRQENAGLAAARNAGFREAQGEAVCLSRCRRRREAGVRVSDDRGARRG